MKSLLFTLGVCLLAGCNTFKPVGPFAKDAPLSQQGKPLASVPSIDPTPPPAIAPTPPTMLVGPSDVKANPQEAANKLSSELGIDSKPSTTGPVTVEVSRVKGGIK
ncbi:hypothetical protein VT84_03670 [Gemmata sp. SH-PL17]|uniref:hypothetical protein n=1 Tax=Gemmata sp. SH-PL17 TaxID=1630693 RepID=UPI00078E0810|nr:hypothetical protein [Gemmata sp. SH-PL17]AMV23482.1 hypothetical protein VT84_03670 [Gemmata sp. SH-PL17]